MCTFMPENIADVIRYRVSDAIRSLTALRALTGTEDRGAIDAAIVDGWGAYVDLLVWQDAGALPSSETAFVQSIIAGLRLRLGMFGEIV